MNDFTLYAGVVLGLLSLLSIVLLVIAPPPVLVPIERRRAPGYVATSTLTRFTDTTVNVIDEAMARRGRAAVDAERLEQANIRMQPAQFVLMVTSSALVLALVGMLLSAGSLWVIPVMVLFAGLAPLGAAVLLHVRTGRRRARFAEQLDESLQLVAGGLRAGHSLLRALDAASKETEAPTAEEFARIVNETRIGRDLGEALDNTALRMRSDDFQWVAQAISINRDVGGNLSQVLDQVSHTIRERNEIRRQVKTLAAEGKLSAWVLILLPVGVFTFLILTQPSYFLGFFGSIWGILALIVAGLLLVLGSLWMMAVVRVKF
jgi:Flp pilus assembly protein TadB